ncbi:MAG: chromosome segregation protein SMC [Dongiaceae bacterium]
MVQFTKLRLAGFKSFVDPTELLIYPGLTGIVGPNGCGKSNLVEALRWAMGETSAKSMRGGEMEDVIFNGSTTRPARNIAEVVLSLDNQDRKVPAHFNDNDELAVSRRIERGSGSSYRVNGQEVRARDVQLLFADSATGAHSTALVSQGRVGALINAKPTDRRALLEEAAGITGLHSRRHEAELRLRAAEANLARLDDVIVTLESQLQALKKQARQAARYRNLNDHIRRVEATLLHLLWQEATARLAAAREALSAAAAQVGAFTGEAATAATRQAGVAADLPPLRQAEAAAAAEVQRLNHARDGLDQEEARIAAAQAEAERRAAQTEADIARESALAEDARAADSRLSAELDSLTAEAAAEGTQIAAATAAVTEAQGAVDAQEAELAAATQQIAAGEAAETAVRRRLAELEGRVARLLQRATDIAAERTRLQLEIADDSALAAARDGLAARQAAFERLQADGPALEQARADAADAETAARARLQDAQSAMARIAAEEKALAALLAANQTDLWPPLMNAVTVTPGYEAALGAALGDDLAASADAGAPLHWEMLPPADGAPALPVGAEPLASFVRGPEVLSRRLAQIGVVASEAEGRALAARLAQGQRLVSRDGAMWRWDGFSVAAGTATTAETRLRQRARLDDLRQELTGLRAALGDAEAVHAAARQAATDAAARERAWRDAFQSALRGVEAARTELDAATQRVAAATARSVALDEASAATEADVAETESQLAAARGDEAALPDLAAVREQARLLQGALADQRSRLIDCRGTQERLQREAQARGQRVGTIADERRLWAQRVAAAEQQLATLAERRAAVSAEIDGLSRRPAEIAAQRQTLLELIEAAEGKRRHAADQLAAAETQLAAAVLELKAAETRLAEAREDRVRAEAAVAQGEEHGNDVVQRIRERLDCAPEETAGIAELKADEAPPAREAVDTRLQRLLRERDNMGPVNLRAEAEAAELEQQIAGLQTERSDLVNAIARLRSGISSLNREGRERLLAAFELVNTNFGTLFTRLFGGGHAHLKLTEAEDPLEAGLEIMASPPGKRLQVMSLLSGGEQALTALSLLFAVFLTNPAPICVLDEVDAPLDDANVDRFCSLVGELAHSTSTRFLVITHHRMTMARMDRLYGVTMAERGVSQLVSVDLQRAAQMQAAE